MWQRMLEVGARRCMLERGHCHRDQRAWVGDAWWSGLRLQVEVYDMLDETCLLSADRELTQAYDPLQLRYDPLEIRIAAADRSEKVCPAFSAASRDPVRRRFECIYDYFQRPAVEDGEISVKMYVRDEIKGRQALLWSSCYYVEGLQCNDVTANDVTRPHLPEGSLHVQQAESLPIHLQPCPSRPSPECSCGVLCAARAGPRGDGGGGQDVAAGGGLPGH
jgi:hypothetical protein